jgi:hypothetical protein
MDINQLAAATRSVRSTGLKSTTLIRDGHLVGASCLD